MMGVQEAPARLFYDFDLDAHVPANHILRQIDRFLDVDIVRAQLRPFYSHLGRPSIDPELIVRAANKNGWLPGSEDMAKATDLLEQINPGAVPTGEEPDEVFQMFGDPGGENQGQIGPHLYKIDGKRPVCPA